MRIWSLVRDIIERRLSKSEPSNGPTSKMEAGPEYIFRKRCGDAEWGNVPFQIERILSTSSMSLASRTVINMTVCE